MPTKIEWCDEVWNPVWGCKNNCPYCYAKGIIKHFGKSDAERNFIPTWREKSFNKKFAKSVQRVFVNSMSDIMYWEREWMDRVINRIKTMPQIQFIFLTKGGYSAYAGYEFPDNVVCGITITKPIDFPIVTRRGLFPAKHWLLNIEPILASFDIEYAMDYAQFFDWIIVGAETGNRKDKVIPERYWFKWLLKYKTPLFIKPSLDHLLNETEIRREYLPLGGSDA